MKGRLRNCLLAALASVLLGAGAIATPVSFYNYEQYGGTWHDAEKSPESTEDDYLCWAAAAGNVLVWTGWSYPVSQDNTDAILDYYEDHWTDAGGLMQYGWSWWFDGVDPGQSSSVVDVPGGGFFDPPDFSDYYRRSDVQSAAMATIKTDLEDGYGVTIGIYKSGGGHALTVWGYKYDDETGDLLGLYVTDSDNSKSSSNPPDLLLYYDLDYSGGKWYLQNFYGTSGVWYVGTVQSLDRNPNPAHLPEPVTIVMMVSGALGLFGVIRRKR